MPLLPENYKFTSKAIKGISRPERKAKPVYPPVEGLVEEPYGIPDWWDYKTFDTDPDGNALPFGAKGWTPKARPYYGDGWAGVWNGFASKILTRTGIVRTEETPEGFLGRAVQSLGAAGHLLVGGPGEGIFGEFAETVSQGLASGVALQEEASGEEVFAPPDEADQTQAQTLRQLGRDQGRMAAEQAFREGIQEGAVDRFAGVREVARVAGSAMETLFLSSPIMRLYNTARIVLSGKDLSESLDTVQAKTDAGRILYSTWVEPALQQEFIRRAQEGEEPSLLSAELENPTAEFIGDMIFDPLNLLEIGAANRVRASIARGSDDIFKRVAPEIANLLDEVSSERAAFESVVELANVVKNRIAARATWLDEIAEARGLAAHTANGKRHIVMTEIGTLLDWAATGADNPDDFLDLMRGVAMMASDDTDEVARGIAFVTGAADRARGVSATPFFSRAGEELSYVLRNALTDADGAFKPNRFMNALDDILRGDELVEGQSRLERLVELSDRTIGKAVDDMFPSVADRIKAGEDVGWMARAVHKFDSGLPGRFVGAANTFFANIYMGFSPGYAVRNFLNNSLTMFIDGVNPLETFQPARNRTAIMGWLGGTLNRKAELGIAQVGALAQRVTRRAPILRLAEAAERGGSLAVSRKAVEESMRMALRPGRALPDIRPLLDAGFSDEVADTITDLAIRHKGNLGAVADDLERMFANGVIETWRHPSRWAGADDLKALEAFGLRSDFEDILGTVDNTLDDARRLIDDIFDRVEEMGREARKEHYGVLRNNDAFPEAAALADSPIDDARKVAAHNFYNANSNVLDEGVYIARRNRDNALRAARDNPDLQLRIGGVLDEFSELVSGSARKAAKAQSEDIADNIRRVTNMIRKEGVEDIDVLWREANLAGEPVDMGIQEFLDYMWDDLVGISGINHGSRRTFWQAVRDMHVERTRQMGDRLRELGIPLDERLYQELDELADYAKGIDTGFILRDRQMYSLGGRPSEILGLTAEEGLGEHSLLLRFVNENLPEGVDEFTDLGMVPRGVLERAIQGQQAPLYSRAEELFTRLDVATEETQNLSIALRQGEIEEAEFLSQVRNIFSDNDEVLTAVDELATPFALDELVPPYPNGATPTFARAYWEQREGLQALRASLLEGMENVRGSTTRVIADDNMRSALSRYLSEAETGVAEARLMASAVADGARDFAFLDYQTKRNANMVLGYLMPYHFWYGGTYRNWVKRLANNPVIMSRYARYRSHLERTHAGAPDWWKYNINTNELLGLDSESPLFFNLEATLNPLNGLTGVDFADRYKRTSWFTTLLDDLNKFGPSTHTLYSLATAVALYAQGEEDAAARWGSRLFPQSAPIRSAAALLFNKGIEVDPATHFFAGGRDPYTTNRIARALAAMVNEGWVNPETGEPITQAEAEEAARLRSGPIWEEADLREATQRGPGQLASYFLGTGFKSRTISDIQIDNFWNDYYRMWAMQPNLSPTEFRETMEQLRVKYPFMNTLLLARKGAEDRDRAYAYSVLSRIPPGASNEFTEFIGLDDELISRFYDSKGNIAEWSEGDRLAFLGGIVQLGAILDVPEDAVRAEWVQAKNAYAEMRTEAERLFGDTIWEEVDAFYALRDGTPQGRELSQNYLDAHPNVEAVLDFKAEQVMGDPLLQAYYGGLGSIESFYQGKMYEAIEEELGEEIWQQWDEYHTIKLTEGRSAARSYWRSHPDLERYTEIRDEWEEIIAENVVTLGQMLPEGEPARLRQTAPEGSEAILGGPGFIEWTPEMWIEQIGGPAYRLTLDSYLGEDLPPTVQDKLEEEAERLGVPGGWLVLYNFIGQSAVGAQVAVP